MLIRLWKVLCIRLRWQLSLGNCVGEVGMLVWEPSSLPVKLEFSEESVEVWEFEDDLGLAPPSMW